MRRAYERALGFQGQIRGFLPHRWPSWFAPRLVDLEPQPFGPFPTSLKLTRAGDVVLVPTSGHTEAHVSVVFQAPQLTYFLAGDASYTQQLMLDQKIDGVSLNEQVARETLRRIRQFVHNVPTVYLPTHDPESAARLSNGTVAALGSVPLQPS